jgi:hypothetical protein
MSFGTAGQRGRWRIAALRREAERRQLEARHKMVLARHRRSVQRARAAVGWYAAGALVSAAGIGLSAGFARVCWSVAAAACAVEAGLWLRIWATRRRAAPPAAPQLPQAVPAAPPASSAAWPALRRLETAVKAIRKLSPALPPDLAELARPSVDAARAAYEMGQAQAAQIGATETALTLVPPDQRASIEQIRVQLLGELDLAAVAVEHLLTSCTRLIGARSGPEAAGQLSAATAEVVARTYGLRAAALSGTDLQP